MGKEENERMLGLTKKVCGFTFFCFLITDLLIFNLLRSSADLQERKIVFMSPIFFHQGTFLSL